MPTIPTFAVHTVALRQAKYSLIVLNPVASFSPLLSPYPNLCIFCIVCMASKLKSVTKSQVLIVHEANIYFTWIFFGKITSRMPWYDQLIEPSIVHKIDLHICFYLHIYVYIRIYITKECKTKKKDKHFSTTYTEIYIWFLNFVWLWINSVKCFVLFFRTDKKAAYSRSVSGN